MGKTEEILHVDALKRLLLAKHKRKSKLYSNGPRIIH
jgi:hypothetical protein